MRAYERLIRYTKFETASDEDCDSCPSTSSQMEFGKYLVEEMKEIGITDACIDEHGYVYGMIPANTVGVDTVGFIAHMDTVRDVPFENVKTTIVDNYDGGIVVLNEALGITLDPKEFPELDEYKGKSLLVTDGTTLLGADNKAGIAEILTMAEQVMADPSIKHGEIKIGFTPDEEIGRGADLFDVKRFGAKFAYTVDGLAFGEVEYENFNAASATISINGVNIHPGTAKGKMVNALSIATKFDQSLPENQRPQYTEGYEGFFHLQKMSGITEHAEMSYIIRDHDDEKFEEKKEMVQMVAQMLNKEYGAGTIEVQIEESYRNMKKQIEPHMEIIDLAFEAIEQAGGTPYNIPVRGGTDGSRLSYMGLPCPNIGTGSHNAHGKKEYAVIEDMDMCVQALINITTILAK